jgi:translocation and assembly module TamB
MTLHKISLIVSKYIAISLCVIALLLATPWGSQLTLSLFNNIDGITFDYHSGTIVRGVKLNSLHLQLDTLDITLEGLSTKFDTTCVLKNTLCIKSAKVDYLSLRYMDNVQDKAEKNISINKSAVNEIDNQQLFEMPFAITAELIEIKDSHLLINNNEIAIKKFVTQLTINRNKFNFSQPTAKQLTVQLENTKTQLPVSKQLLAPSINEIFAQLPEINLPISLIIKQLFVDKIIITEKKHPKGDCHNNCPQWYSSNNQLSGTWLHTDVSISQFTTITPEFSITQFTTDANLTPPYQITTHLVSQVNTVSWWPEITNTTQVVSIQGAFDDLNFDISSQGDLSLTSQGKVNLVNQNMPFNVELKVKKIPTPLSLTSYGDYSSLSLLLAGDLTEQIFDLTGQVKGYGYNDAKVEIKATHKKDKFSIEHLLFNDTDSKSQLNLQGHIEILPTDITWQLFADSSGLSLPKISLTGLTELVKNIEQSELLVANIPDAITGRLQGKIASTGSWSDNTWSLTLSNTKISGQINNHELNVKANISLNPSGQHQQGELFFKVDNSELILEAKNSSFWDLNGQLTVDNIQQWHPDINGAFTSHFSITGEINNPVIQLKSLFTKLNWQQLYSNLLAVEARYQPMNNHKIDFSLTNDQLTWMNESKTFSAGDIYLMVKGNANQHQIKGSWLGDSTGQVALTGSWNDTFTHWKSTVKNSELTYQNTAISNDNIFALNIDLAKQQSVIQSHCWQGKGLNICLPNKTIIGDSGDVAIQLAIDLSVIDELFLLKNIEIISQVKGDLNVKWSIQQPINAKARFTLSSGHVNAIDDFNEHQLSQWSKGLFSFTIDEQHFSNQLLLTSTSDTPLLNIASTVDFISNSPSKNLSVDDHSFGESPVNAQITLNQFNIQPFQAILTNVVNLQGKLTTNLTVDGTLNSPVLNGQLALGEGKLQLRQNANSVENITSLISIKRNQATLNGSFTVEDQEASLSGEMSWKNSLFMNIDLTADALPLVFPPQLVMSVSPNLNFSLKEKSLIISGNIDVLDGSYNIEKLPESSVPLSDDVIILNQNGQTVIKKSSGFDIKTNISVNIADAFNVTGQGLQTHLFGQLQISQKEKHPFQLFGQIQSTDGTFEAYGQKLLIEKGEFTFNGPIDNPYFNLEASRHIKASDIDVGIKITGFAEALDMQLFSSPSMEMPEMFSYLVRGRGLDSGTGNSAAAASLLVGFGVTNSFGLFDQIEKIPLINNIAVDTEGEGDKTQATVSGYVGNRVYLKYGVGVYEPINELTVRMFLFNRFWLEIVSGIEQSTDFYYSFDID